MKIIGNLQVLGKTSIIQMNPFPASNFEYSGWISQEIVDVAVIRGQLLYFNVETQHLTLAQANSQDTLPARAIALETKNPGELCRVLRKGTLRNNDWGFSGNSIYVSPTTAGGLVDSQPTSSGQLIQLIGHPIGSNVAYFDFSPIIIEIA